jgi:tetratricopeptide (TPR) repeat protein
MPGERINPRLALVGQGKYKEALRSLDQSLQKRPRESLRYHERAHLHLYLGHPQQARSDFDTAARLQAATFGTRPGRLQSDIEYNAIGVTYWMEDHKELAVAFWRYTTSMLYKGRVSYSHIGGGIEAGLLLWFGAVHAHSEDDIALVRKFYEKRLASTFWSHNLTSWPGPIVRFFLESIGEEDLLNEAKKPHNLCEAHFALAIRARAVRRYAAYQKHLELAAPRKSPSEVYGFYNCWPYSLAKYELEASSKSRR